MADPGIEAKIATIARACEYGSPDRYTSRARYLFEGVDLAGKRVLEIGCGSGAWALWSGMEGASYVLGIEPEVTGSTASTFKRFLKTIDEVGLKKTVEGKPEMVQDLEIREPFDVIVSFNVINHFSEAHTKTLHLPESRDFYIDVFRGLRKILKPGGTMILADCGRTNFFGDRGMVVPWTRGVCWKVHQNPDVWTSVLEQSGFRTVSVRWSYPYPLTWLKLNQAMAYFWNSHFVIRVEAI